MEEIETSEVPETPIAEDKPAWVKAAEAVEGLEYTTPVEAILGVEPTTTKRKKVTDEEFISAWQTGANVKEVAEKLSMKADSVRARKAKLVRTFAKAGVPLNLKVHPRTPGGGRVALANDPEKLASLSALAEKLMHTEEQELDESED